MFSIIVYGKIKYKKYTKIIFINLQYEKYGEQLIRILAALKKKTDEKIYF